MRTIAIGTAMILALLVPVSSNYSYAQQGNPSGQGGWYGCCGRAAGPGGWYCPWAGGGYGGYQRGRGGTSYYNQGGQPAGGPSSYNQGGQPLSKAQAEQLLMEHIQGNPNLKVGKIADKVDLYEATIVTKKEGALVERIQVDKKTGWFRNVQ